MIAPLQKKYTIIHRGTALQIEEMKEYEIRGILPKTEGWNFYSSLLLVSSLT